MTMKITDLHSGDLYNSGGFFQKRMFMFIEFIYSNEFDVHNIGVKFLTSSGDVLTILHHKDDEVTIIRKMALIQK